MFNTSMVNLSMDKIEEDAAEKHIARDIFARRLWAGRSLGAVSKLTRRSRHLVHISEVATSSKGRDIGIQIVPVDAICGTEGRTDEFDREFYPLQEYVEHRWVSVAAAMMRGISLPPIELIKIDDFYFVRDGHHRVSVARANGQKTMEAHVILWE